MNLDPQSASSEAYAKPKWPFRLKLTMLTISLALLPVAVVGLIAINVNKGALSEANKELLYSVIHHVTRHTENGIARDREQLSIAASSLMDTNQDLEQRLSVLHALVGGGRLSAIAVYDDKGQWIDTVRRDGKDVGQVPVFPSQLSEKMLALTDTADFAIGPIEAMASENDFRVLLLAKSTGGDSNWFLVSEYRTSSMQSELESFGNERLGRGHSLLVVDTSLNILADSHIEHRGEAVSPNRLGILDTVDPNALDEGILLFGESSLENRSMLGAVRSMETLPWAVVAEIPRDVALYSIAKITRILWIVVVVAGLSALLIGVFMARRISAPLQTLVSFAGDLANRRFDKRVTVQTRDELGVLGQALSSAASELQASDIRIRKEERIRTDLGRYLPGGLVDRIVDEKQELRLGGDRCEITVLFADIVGFTPLAESHSAEEVVSLLNDLFTILTEIIFRHSGTVDKFLGDSVMAFWGAPDPQSNHAELALRAAEDMLRWLEIGNESWKLQYGIEIQLAIGVNTGEAVVGNLGSNARMEYTAIGDCVNVAARLESIARPQQILLTKATKDAAGDGFDVASLGSREVVGRRGPLELFEIRV